MIIMFKYETRIADLRVDNDLKQKDIAEQLDITRSLYSLWEIGKCDIPLLKINELANFYKVNLDYLLGISNVVTKTERNSINLDLLCKRLKELRIENKLTEENLGNKIGLAQQTYDNYEKGTRIPTTFKVLYIVKYYNISFDYIVGRTDNRNN